MDLQLLFAAQDDPVKAWTMFSTPKAELSKFMISLGELSIGMDKLDFSNYPFEPSIALSTKTISATDVEDVNFSSRPLTIKVNGELLFVSVEQKDALLNFITRNNIPIVERSDIWRWILEPFLDTEFTEKNCVLLDALLADYGLSEDTVLSLRREVEVQMLKYNFDTMLWEWCFFDLYDVLSAMRAKYDKDEFDIFFKKAMKIALLHNE